MKIKKKTNLGLDRSLGGETQISNNCLENRHPSVSSRATKIGRVTMTYQKISDLR